MDGNKSLPLRTTSFTAEAESTRAIMIRVQNHFWVGHEATAVIKVVAGGPKQHGDPAHAVPTRGVAHDLPVLYVQLSNNALRSSEPMRESPDFHRA